MVSLHQISFGVPTRKDPFQNSPQKPFFGCWRTFNPDFLFFPGFRRSCTTSLQISSMLNFTSNTIGCFDFSLIPLKISSQNLGTIPENGFLSQCCCLAVNKPALRWRGGGGRAFSPTRVFSRQLKNDDRYGRETQVGTLLGINFTSSINASEKFIEFF